MAAQLDERTAVTACLTEQGCTADLHNCCCLGEEDGSNLTSIAAAVRSTTSLRRDLLEVDYYPAPCPPPAPCPAAAAAVASCETTDFGRDDRVRVGDVTVFVDPLDGTREFVEGRLEAVTSLVGIAVGGRAVGGAIGLPFGGPKFFGSSGEQDDDDGEIALSAARSSSSARIASAI